MAIKLKLNFNERDSSATLSIKGELDQVTLTEDYYHNLKTTDKTRIESSQTLQVDLIDVKRADTAGLAWLLNLKKDIQERNTQVKFANVPSKLLNLAELSNAKQFIG